jgi:hypothetical protein
MTAQRALLTLTCLSLAACGASATLVEREPSRGRIALEGPYVSAMQEARELMLAECKGRYRMHESNGEVAFECVGQPIVASAEVGSAED